MLKMHNNKRNKVEPFIITDAKTLTPEKGKHAIHICFLHAIKS